MPNTPDILPAGAEASVVSGLQRLNSNPELISEQLGDITDRETKTSRLSDDQQQEVAANEEQGRQAGNQLRRSAKGALKKINDIFDGESGEKFTEQDREQAEKSPPRLPTFPITISIFALIKDILDVPENLSAVAAGLATLTSIPISLIILKWVWEKTAGGTAGGWLKKKMIRWVWMKYIGAVIIEFIPFINFVPTYTIFILMTHRKEIKLVRGMKQIMEKIRHRKKLLHA